MKTFNTVAEIKAEREFQRSNPVIYSLLGVLLGEIDRLPIPRTQSPSKDQIYAIVKKLYEGAELLASKDWSEEAKIEYAYLKDYIKQQLSEEEIRQIISKSGLNQIGAIMNYFKSYHSGQYDGKLVSQIAKEVAC
jgi:Glu-tRNA(Gln) amidotransferase subunit E-like FAD-binding protein